MRASLSFTGLSASVVLGTFCSVNIRTIEISSSHPAVLHKDVAVWMSFIVTSIRYFENLII